jgi:predicted amidohydrolase YtcJ
MELHSGQLSRFITPRLFMRGRALVLALAVLGTAEAPAVNAQALLPADIIYDHGKFITNNPAADSAESVAIRDGRIIAVGSSSDVKRHAGPVTKVVDLKGMTALPGFYDNHIHLGGEVDIRNQSWEHINSKAALMEVVKARAAAIPKGEWILGELDNENMPQERLPTRWELDTVTPDHPVVLHRGHVAIGNSLAMKLSGVTNETKAPEGGDIDRNAKGEAIGWFREGAGRRLITKGLPPQPETPNAIAQGELQKELAAKLPLGITSVNVAGMRPHTMKWIQNLYEEQGESLPRATVQLRVTPGFDTFDDEELGVSTSIK